jgi:transposase
MFLKTQTVRKPSGKSYTYYRLVESYRQDGKVNHRVLAQLGALTPQEVQYLARRFAGIAGIELSEDLEELEVNGLSYFGPPLLVERLMEVLRLTPWVQEAVESKRVKFDVVEALKVMLCAHLFKSGSRAELAVWDWQQKLFWHPHRVADLEYHHLLRTLNVLVEIKDEIEEKLFWHLRDLFDVSVDLVFYDLTSSYVEGQASWSELFKLGYSRDKRADCKQVVIGLVVTGEGFPVTFRVFEGNRLDKTTLKAMVDDLKGRFSIRRCIWVSDAGLLTDKNLQMLQDSEYEYILGMGGSEHRTDVMEAVKKTQELKQKKFKDSKFWEVEVKEQEESSEESEPMPKRRIIVVESQGRRKKTAAIFEARLEKVRQAFSSLERQIEKGKYVKREDIRVEAEKILHRSRVTKYFTFRARKGKLAWEEDHGAVAQRKANAGKYALLAACDLPAQEVLCAYRTLLAVEDAFLVLKDILDLRPFWHKSDDNIEGHVLLAVWSYLLYKSLDTLLAKKGIEVSTPRVLNAIKEVRAVEVAVRDKAVWKLMKVPARSQQAFQAVGISNLKARFNEWARNAPAYHYEPRVMKKGAPKS